jgi:hypothetical protein
MKTWIFLILALVLLLPSVFAQTINLAWDPHEEAATITGFHLLQTKTPGSYSVSSPVATFTPGTLTTGSIPKPGLGKYCWVLTAFFQDPTGPIDSAYSNEVCDVLKPKPPKLNSAVQTIAMAPIKGVVKAAKWLVAEDEQPGKKKGLRIEKVK